jgi:hypothetical protein
LIKNGESTTAAPVSKTGTLTATNANINTNRHSIVSTATTVAGDALPHQNSTQNQTFESPVRDNAYLIIKRLMGCLGNVNMIKDPLIHKRIFDFIYSKWELLGKVENFY